MPVTTFFRSGHFPSASRRDIYYTMLAHEQALNCLQQLVYHRHDAWHRLRVVAAAIVANTILDTAERLRKRNGSRRQRYLTTA